MVALKAYEENDSECLYEKMNLKAYEENGFERLWGKWL